MWERACPWCSTRGLKVMLVKRSLWQVIRCKCGWIWGQEPHLITTEKLVPGPGRLPARPKA